VPHSVYCHLRTGDIKIVRTRMPVPSGADVNIDYDSAGDPIGVEILNVHQVTIDGQDVT
jgi:uncharacterized protein YuzE